MSRKAREDDAALGSGDFGGFTPRPAGICDDRSGILAAKPEDKLAGCTK